jgi:hypothetical protein
MESLFLLHLDITTNCFSGPPIIMYWSYLASEIGGYIAPRNFANHGGIV